MAHPRTPCTSLRSVLLHSTNLGLGSTYVGMYTSLKPLRWFQAIIKITLGLEKHIIYQIIHPSLSCLLFSFFFFFFLFIFILYPITILFTYSWNHPSNVLSWNYFEQIISLLYRVTESTAMCFVSFEARLSTITRIRYHEWNSYLADCVRYI